MLSLLVGETSLTSPIQRLPTSLTLGSWGLGACHRGCGGWAISRPMLCCSTACTMEGGTLLLSMNWTVALGQNVAISSVSGLLPPAEGHPLLPAVWHYLQRLSVTMGNKRQTEIRSSSTPTCQAKHVGRKEDNKANKEWNSPVILFWKELEQVPLAPAQVLPKCLSAYCLCAGTKIVCGPFKWKA